MQTEYILKAMDAALAAGKEILNVYNDPSSDFQVERKADNSPLTLADRKAHETIMTYLQETDYLWGIERSGFFNGREKWAKGFENQRV